jgi:hypothetical protein
LLRNHVFNEKENRFQYFLLKMTVNRDVGEEIDEYVKGDLILLPNFTHILAKEFREVGGGGKQTRKAEDRFLFLLHGERVQKGELGEKGVVNCDVLEK